VLKHFYTTDFFQPAAFYKDQQLISIYYLVKNISPFTPALKGANTNKLFIEKYEHQHPFRDGRAEGAQSFRWVSVSELNAEEFTFPIDKKVAIMLRGQGK